ncbi:MAG: hypothetical protein F6K30_16975 [Cyanothece sp. SIO2G6]|nr:hypothetical protein [Cyanothece sp. SIO2G6]
MDFQTRQKNIKRSYIICSTGRSGSTLLSKTLVKLEQFGNPDEYFHHMNIEELQLKKKPERFIPYFESVLDKGLSANGTFAIKMHWWQLNDFLETTRQLDVFEGMTDIEILNSAFPNLKFIYIWRQDMVAQAVSTEVALQTGVWMQGVNSSVSSYAFKVNSAEVPNIAPNMKNIEQESAKLAQTSVKFRPLRIYKWEQKFKDQNRRWQQFFAKHQLEYHELTYERLTHNFEQEMTDVIRFLELETEVDLSLLKMPTKRQANAVNEQFATYYKALPAIFLKGINKLNLLFS